MGGEEGDYTRRKVLSTRLKQNDICGAISIFYEFNDIFIVKTMPLDHYLC
jgi:hypothetical protein